MTDIFHEVEEELRRERLRTLWDRYGIFVIGAAVALVLVTAGYRGWLYWQNGRAASSGDMFVTAVDLADNDDYPAAITALEKVIAEGTGGYPVLARFRLATVKASSGDTAGAVVDFDRLAADSDIDPHLRNLARIRAAMILVDSATRQDVEKRVAELAEGSTTWRNMAAELIGLAAWKSDDLAAAGKWYERILGDPSAPETIKRRAQLALAVIAAAGGPVEPPALGSAPPVEPGGN